MPIHFTCPHCGAQTNVAEHFAGQSGPCAACGRTITVPRAFDEAVPRVQRSSAGPIILIIFAVIVAVVIGGGILAALLLPAIGGAREAARRAACLNNLRQISLALAQYEQANGTFPPAYLADKTGKPMHSWRVLILPYLGLQSVYQQYKFDEPWDGPNNSKLLDTILSVYRCPSDGTGKPTDTDYVMVIGPGTVSTGTSAAVLADFRDGLSNTIMVVETTGLHAHWMAPVDLKLDQMSFQINNSAKPGIRSAHPGGANVGMADGSVHFLSNETDPATLKALLTIAGGEAIDIDMFP